MPKTIVVIDDLRTFTEDSMEKLHKGGVEDVRYFRTSDEAVAAFNSGVDDVIEVWWDYDLGGEDVAYSAAEWFEKQAYFKTEAFYALKDVTMVVHTDNPVGRGALEWALGKTWSLRNVNAADFFRVG